MKSLLLTLFITCLAYKAYSETVCEFLPPLEDSPGQDGPDYGIISIPGADITGEAYKPLAEVIQANFPGKMWVGVTELWFADYPNPGEIETSVDQCLQAAEEAGYDTTWTFLFGHSLGGVVLQDFIRNNPDLSKGLILYGSWLFDDQVEDHTFPVPVLTAIGTLDGAGVPNIMIEADDAATANAAVPMNEVTWALDRVNHAQVASGEIPDVVIKQDIPPERSNEEAHEIYAKAGVSWIVWRYEENFDADTIDEQLAIFQQYQEFTDTFLVPWYEMAALEANEDRTNSPWVEQGQEILMHLTADEESYVDDYLTVTDTMVTLDELGPVKPGLDSVDECQVEVTTYSYIDNIITPVGLYALQSADVIKAKFKLEDLVNEALCLFEPKERSQCKEINQAAIDRALSVADDISRDRYLSQGRQLVPVNDFVTCCGPGWLDSNGLTYTQVDDLTVELQAVTLVTEPDIIPLLAGVRYCDLLSPYRALEWIYVSGVQHG